MPEYILPGKELPEFNALPDLVRGYIEAAFFTSEDIDGEGGDRVPEGAGFDDLAPETLASIIADCEKLESQYGATLAALYEADSGPGDYDAESAGRDFWYTRNGHGVGFWDRGFTGDAATAADVLTTALDWNGEYGGSDWYRGDDGKVYAE